MISMLKKVSIASALALTLSVSAQAKTNVIPGGMIVDSGAVIGNVSNGSFQDLINFTVSPNIGAGITTSGLTYNAKGASLNFAALYEGAFTSLSQLTNKTAIWSSSTVVATVDGKTVSTKITGDVGTLDFSKTYTLLVKGASAGNGTYTAQITLDALPAVPEPETYAMLLAGLGLMGAIARRKSKRTVSTEMAAA